MYITNTDTIIQKASDDIISIISAHTNLKNSGGSSYSGCCPFHKEKTASFKVDADKQVFHCFGCNISGGIVKFIQEIHHVSFVDAIQELSLITGIPCEYATNGQSNQNEPNPYANNQELINLCTQAQIHYHNNLINNPKVLEYCHNRGIDKTIICKYLLGYADQKKIKEISDNKEKLIKAGLLQRSKEHNGTYDPLSNRLVIPLHTTTGRVIGFTGRYIGDKAVKNKYINTPTTNIYKKSEVLFGYHIAKKILMDNKRKTYPIIIEGQIKAIACLEAGYACVAPGGTALTDNQVKLLTTLSKGDTIGIIPDNDNAGKIACTKHIAKLCNYINNIYILELKIPQELQTKNKVDPDDLLKDNHPILFTATDPITWAYNNTITHKKETQEWASEILQKIIEPLINPITNKTVKYIKTKQLSTLSGIPTNWLAINKIPPVNYQPPQTAIQVDTTITHSALLCATVLQIEIIEEAPNSWQSFINWTELPTSTATALIKIGKLRNCCVERGINIQNAISISNIPPNQKELLLAWSTIKLPTNDIRKLLGDTQTLIITDEQLKTQQTGIQ